MESTVESYLAQLSTEARDRGLPVPPTLPAPTPTPVALLPATPTKSDGDQQRYAANPAPDLLQAAKKHSAPGQPHTVVDVAGDESKYTRRLPAAHGWVHLCLCQVPQQSTDAIAGAACLRGGMAAGRA